MYLRHTTITKNGKCHTYWRLVRSVRVGNTVRQQTVAQLGELDAAGRIRAQALAEAIVGIERQPGLFEEPGPTEPATVDLRGLRLERGRRFGDVWLGLRLWQALGLDTLLQQLLPRGREDVPWATMAAVLVLARFCEPSSELHIAEDWFRRTALGDLLGIADDKVNDDRLYRALDRVLPQKLFLEVHLQQRLGRLFALEYDLLLYDITSTYFEGQAAANPQAQRGHSRDHRRDCKQVLIGLVVSRDGYPLGYEVFAGNRHDGTTLEEIVKRMEALYGRQGRIWVLDRGMVSEASLAWLRGRGSRYIVGTPRSRLKQFARAVRHGAWEALREGLEVQRCPGGGGGETFILCRSADRAAKEQAIRERFVARIEAGLKKIRAACRRRRCDPGKVERRVGRLLGQNARAAGLFRVVVETGPDGGTRVRWRRRAAAQAWARSSQGCYVLRSNVADWDADELWRAYMQLSDAEAAFRIQKTDLRLRPVWHQTAGRVQAHLLVCFLAYVLRKTLEGWMARAGLGNSPTTVLEELGRIQSTDVVAPTTDGRTIRLRCVVRPDKAQSILLDRLGLKLPQRLRLPAGMGRM
ncbi:MAG TPA: IS1634 family transposase [Gemmataceae bacterium]|jgi:transposase|nr:IS1634 family transposase [Gemmataceae bacterium]